MLKWAILEGSHSKKVIVRDDIKTWIEEDGLGIMGIYVS